MLSQLLLSLCRRSWRIYQWADFHAADGERVIPIIRGLGLDLFRPPDPGLLGAIRHVAAAGRTGCFIDVGANLGQSLLLLQHTRLQLPYLGFEPNPDAAYYVHRLIEANRFANSWVLPVGLSSREGSAVLHLNSKGDESGTVETGVRPLSMYEKELRIALTTGDRQLADVDEIFFVKLDCEGHEIQALQGMRGVIASRRPPLYFEVMGYSHLLDGSYPRDYFGELTAEQIESVVEARRRNCLQLDELIAALGYRLTRVIAGQLQRVQRIADTLPGKGEMNFLAEPPA
jgi:FkbM family methyltransferase